ncbi:MAG: DUF3096 domain-containing protein [Nanoarchaeota archaeon]
MVQIVSLALSGILAIVLGLLILFFPKFLRWGVGIYLLVAGVLQIIAGY